MQNLFVRSVVGATFCAVSAIPSLADDEATKVSKNIGNTGVFAPGEDAKPAEGKRNPFAVTLPDGAMIEVVGICTHPSMPGT